MSETIQQNLWASIAKSVTDIQRLYDPSSEFSTNIFEKINTIESESDKSFDQIVELYKLYKDALNVAAVEKQMLSRVVLQVERLIATINPTPSPKVAAAHISAPLISPDSKKRRKSDVESVSPTSPNLKKGKSEHIPNDTLVAAKTIKEKDEWILATIVQYIANRQRYEVEDVDDEEDPLKEGGGARKKYTLPPKQVIALPPVNEQSVIFPLRHPVLALFPQTTCLYKGIVLGNPNERKTKDYLIAFDDDDVPGRPVSARYVIDRKFI